MNLVTTKKSNGKPWTDEHLIVTSGSVEAGAVLAASRLFLARCQESFTVFLQLCTASVSTGYSSLVLLPVLSFDSALPQPVCQIEATSPTKKVICNDGVNSCGISPPLNQ